jgi:hypothetical protein
VDLVGQWEVGRQRHLRLGGKENPVCGRDVELFHIGRGGTPVMGGTGDNQDEGEGQYSDQAGDEEGAFHIPTRHRGRWILYAGIRANGE